MENLLNYFLKANGLIILFYLMYVLFLRKETFFNSNRWYLITGLLLSLVLPLITFTKTIWIEPTPLPEVYKDAIPLTYNQTEIPKETVNIDWSIILSSAYTVIAILILVKIGIELFAFFAKIKKHNKQKNTTYTIVETNTNENPFSFFRYIVINKDMFTDEEIEHILTHESIHVNQKHSFDVLLGKLFCAFFWVNPIIWLYRKAILQNLEFIADNETFQQIENKYAYQKTLLKVVTHQHNLSITNQFYQSLIKKRIVMLNTNQSHKRNAWKYATILPLLVGFFIMFQIETIAQVKETKIEEKEYVISSDYASVLTKNSTDKELNELQKAFSNENQKLVISKVKRNKNNEIIAIKIEFKDANGNKGINEIKGDEPIKPIYLNSEDGTIAFANTPHISDAMVNQKLVNLDNDVKIKIVKKIEDKDFPTPPTPPTPPNHPFENIADVPTPPDFPNVPDLPSNFENKKEMEKYEKAMKVFEKKMKAIEPKMKEFEKKMEAWDKEMKLKEPDMKKFEEEMKVFEEKMKVFEKEMEAYEKELEKIEKF